MNILCAYESGNAQADLLRKGLQASGHQTTLCSLGLESVKEKIREGFPVDVIHCHNASLVASDFSGIDLATDGTYATFIQYDTSELRTRFEAIRCNPYANLDPHYQDETVTSRLQLLSRLYRACIVQSHEAAEYAVKYHRRVYIVPYAIDLKEIDRLPAAPLRSNTSPLIVHPCLDESKGTEFIEEVVGRLRKEGYRFDYLRVENCNRADTLRKMQEADIVIDQLLHGWYGIISVEAMALGKPVISHIREDLRYKYGPALPIISANPATLYRKLVPLLRDARIRERAGKAGRKYVEKHHQVDAVINKLMWVFRNEIDHLENSSSVDERMILDSITGNSVVAGEDTEEIDFAVEMYITTPDQQNNSFNFDPVTDNTVVMEEDTDTIGTMDGIDNNPINEPNEQIVFDSTIENPAVAGEDSEEIDAAVEAKITSINQRNNPIKFDPMNDSTVGAEEDTETIDVMDGMVNHPSNPSNKQSVLFSNRTAKPKKSVRVKGANQSTTRPVCRSPYRCTQVCHFRPNRYCVRKQSKNKSATYVSFDLSKLPSSIIAKAFIVLPIVLKKNQKVSVVRIKRNWSPKRAKSKPPIVYPKRIARLSTESVSRVLNWKCTELVKHWHRHPSKNYGVRISKRLRKQPTLVVNFYLPFKKACQKACRCTQVCYFRPNRYCVRKQSKNKSATYVSFDLSKLPSSSIITKTVIVLPIVLKRNQKVSVVRIRRNWSPKRTKSRPPIVYPKRIARLSTKSVSRVFNWQCTKLVKHWCSNPSKNFGVRISKRLRKPPKLVVHFHKK